MWLQFFAQNAHFVINLFAALICLGICWLYLDAWSNRHERKELAKWVGFALLGISFLLHATIIEQSVLGESVLGNWSIGAATVSKILAYALIIIGQVIDPLNAVPDNKGLKLKDQSNPEEPLQAPAIFTTAVLGLKLLIPMGGFTVAALYWRRAKAGLENHLKPVSRAFLFFGISDLIGLSSLLHNTSNPILYTYVAAFGWLWWLQLTTLLVGVILLGFWTWGYLLERFFTQLYMIFTGMIVIVFMIVSVGFTGLLLRNIHSNSLANLSTASSVLNYAVESRQSETTSAAQQLADSSDIIAAIKNRDREKLISLTANFLSLKKLTGLVITDASGQVLLRAQDTEQWGDSLSNDALVKRALLGLNQSTVSVRDGVASPVLEVRSAATIGGEGAISGSVITSLELGSAFVDGVKQKTGLQISIYAKNTLVATTLTGPDGKSRPVGARISSAKIKDTVLNKGRVFSGESIVQQRRMLTVFAPITDVDKVPVGMLLVAEPQSSVLLTAGRSVEITFIIMALVLLLSIYPIQLIVKSLVRQIE